MDMEINLDTLTDLVERARENIIAVAAGFTIGAVLLGYIIFISTSFVPNWVAYEDISGQIEEANRQVLQIKAQDTTQSQIGELPDKIDAAENQFQTQVNQLLRENEAGLVLDRLYQYAAQTNISIIDIQSPGLSDPQNADTPYLSKQFLFVALGDPADLFAFLGTIQETNFPTVNIDEVLIQGIDGELDGEGEIESEGQLSFALTLHTSPLSAGDTLGQLVSEPNSVEIGKLDESEVDIPREPIQGTVISTTVSAEGGQETTTMPTPTPNPSAYPSPPPSSPPTQQEILTNSLHDPWARGDWQSVIGIIQAILVADPGNAEMQEKLYAAYVNDAINRSMMGDLDGARISYSNAANLFPSRPEAISGLESIAPTPIPTATPVPQPRIHVVKSGDTLYSISKRYGTTVDTLRQINGLSGNNIDVGQQLSLP